MKRFLIVIALILLLGGCTGKVPQSAEGEFTQMPPPVGEGLYDAEHPVEAQTNGAVKAYTFSEQECISIFAMGDHHLLMTKEGITLLKGENLAPSVSVAIQDLQISGICVRDNGVAYHDRETGSIVFLNEHLRRTSTLELPENAVGGALIASDWSKIYYCTEDGLKVLDVGTGIASILLAYEAQWQGISGSFQDGSVLRCSFLTPENTVRTVAVSAQTGTLLAEGDHLLSLLGSGQNYFLEMQTDETREYIFGTGQEQPCNFFPAESADVIALPDADRILQIVLAEQGVTLDCYQMHDGKRIARVYLSDITQVSCIGAQDQRIWLSSGDMLYCWDTSKSAIMDETAYWAYRYNRNDPDEAGLQLVGDRLEEMQQQYGVQILYWDEPERLAPWEYVFETEYIPENYQRYLEELENVLKQFPQDFFSKAARWTNSGQMHIVLVRGIYGAAEGYESASGIFYDLNGEAYLALSLQDGVAQNFYHVIGHMVDTKVLSTCDAYTNWKDLNPWDFKYDNDYIKNQDRTGTKYIEGEKRYFVDHYSMSFAVEDRARILEYACMPDNEEVFASKYMQKKLKTVCAGIRQAFELPEGEYLWEQYLK